MQNASIADLSRLKKDHLQELSPFKYYVTFRK